MTFFRRGVGGGGGGGPITSQSQTYWRLKISLILDVIVSPSAMVSVVIFITRCTHLQSS